MSDSSQTEIYVLITVRSTSSRLPRKCFLPFGDYSVLEHVIRRAMHYDFIPIVCTTRDKEDDEVQELADRLNVKCFRGSTLNKLQRWRDCCQHYEVKRFHSVDADDPFFCGDEIKRSMALLEEGYDMVSPSPSSSNGGATVGYSLTADIITRACEGLAENTDTEMMWSFVERLPGLRKAMLDDPVDAVVKARMTLDYPEDYILLEAVRLILGNLARRQEVSKLFESNPDLQRVNAFRNEEWAAGQQEKSLII